MGGKVAPRDEEPQHRSTGSNILSETEVHDSAHSINLN